MKEGQVPRRQDTKRVSHYRLAIGERDEGSLGPGSVLHLDVAHICTLTVRSWTWLHLSAEDDAERHLKLVVEDLGVGITGDGEPADGFQIYRVD